MIFLECDTKNWTYADVVASSMSPYPTPTPTPAHDHNHSESLPIIIKFSYRQFETTELWEFLGAFFGGRVLSGISPIMSQRSGAKETEHIRKHTHCKCSLLFVPECRRALQNTILMILSLSNAQFYQLHPMQMLETISTYIINVPNLKWLVN